jgi:hypothetical protein
MTEIKVQAFTIESIEIKTTDEEYRTARADSELADRYDAHLSDMDGETVIIEPETGVAFDPYAGQDVDLMDLLRPILAHVPTWVIDQYAASRRAEEE